MDFVKLAYGYLPLVWAANLAHYLRLGLQEGRAHNSGFFGHLWQLRGEFAGLDCPPCSGSLLTGEYFNYRHRVINLAGAKKIARQPLPSMVVYHGCTVLFGFSLWSLIVGF